MFYSIENIVIKALCFSFFLVITHAGSAMEHAEPKYLTTGPLEALLYLKDQKLITRSNKKEAPAWVLWNTQTLEKIKQAHPNRFTSPDQPYFVSSPSYDGKICILLESGNPLLVWYNIENHDELLAQTDRYSFATKLIRWAPNGLTYWSLGNTTLVFNPDQKDPIWGYAMLVRKYSVGYDQISPSGKLGLLETEDNRFSIECPYTRNIAGSMSKRDDPSSFVWSPDESNIACPVGDMIEIFDIPTGKERLIIKPSKTNDSNIEYLQYAGDNTLAASSSNSIYLLETKKGTVLKELKSPETNIPISMFRINPEKTEIAAYQQNKVLLFPYDLNNKSKKAESEDLCSIQ